jgi:hypothetical protein
LDQILARPLWRDSLERVVISIMLPRGNLLDPSDRDLVRLRLPMISNVPSVSLTIQSMMRPEGNRDDSGMW